MTYYSVLAVTPASEDWISEYIGRANALVAQHGEKYLARTASMPRTISSDLLGSRAWGWGAGDFA